MAAWGMFPLKRCIEYRMHTEKRRFGIRNPHFYKFLVFNSIAIVPLMSIKKKTAQSSINPSYRSKNAYLPPKKFKSYTKNASHQPKNACHRSKIQVIDLKCRSSTKKCKSSNKKMHVIDQKYKSSI